MDIFNRIPLWGWIAAGIGVIAVIFLAGSGGSNAQSTATPSTDVNDILNQLQNAADLVGGGGGTSGGSTTTTKTVTKTIKPGSLWGSDIPASIRSLSSESAATLFKKYHINYGTKINMGDLRALLRKMKINYGSTIDRKDLIKAGIIPELPTTETTSESNSTVPPSNNGVTP